jgi:hypothetical protein
MPGEAQGNKGPGNEVRGREYLLLGNIHFLEGWHQGFGRTLMITDRSPLLILIHA